MDGQEESRNLHDLIQTAQRIQAEVTRIKDELALKTAEGESGGGLGRCGLWRRRYEPVDDPAVPRSRRARRRN